MNHSKSESIVTFAGPRISDNLNPKTNKLTEKAINPAPHKVQLTTHAEASVVHKRLLYHPTIQATELAQTA